MTYFTKEKIKDLTENHNWELAHHVNDYYILRQKDKDYIKTVPFTLPEGVKPPLTER